MTTALSCKAIARQFGELIAKGEYEAVRKLLTIEGRKNFYPEDLEDAVARMTSYAPGPIRHVEVFDEVLEDWPAKGCFDVGCVYVALEGDDYCEAAYLTIAREGVDYRISKIAWGRP